MIKKYILASIFILSFTGCDEIFKAIDDTKSDVVKEGLISVKYFAFKDTEVDETLPISCMKFKDDDILSVVKKDQNGADFTVELKYSIADNEVEILDGEDSIIFHINQNNIGDNSFISISNPNYSITKNADCLNVLIAE